MSKIWSAMVGSAIRVYIADTTEMVKEAVEIHQSSEVSGIAFGRTLTATSLLGKLLKNKTDVLTLKVGGTNQIKTILVTANSLGHVKGFISNNEADLSYQSSNEKISDAIGKGGSITVIRDFGLKEPYVGISHLISGEIDEDIAFYYKNSEQQPTALKLDVKYKDGKVLAAGGILIQPLPDAPIIEKEAFELAHEKIQDITNRLYKGESPETILKAYFTDLEVRITGEFDTEFKCDCSRERISRALLTVGKDELKEILTVDQEATLKCHFCNTSYHFNQKDLVDMIEALND